MISKHKHWLTISLFALTMAAGTSALRAQDVDIIPLTPSQAEKMLLENEDTHPAVSITPDKSTIIKLDQDIASLFVGNPQHLNVLVDSTKTLVLVGRAPGATYFTALDKNNNIIMQRHVFVAAPKEGYVRVRNTCLLSETDGCENTEVYYCPDTCHQVLLNNANENESAEAPSTVGGGGSPDTAGAGDLGNLGEISDALSE